MPRFAANLTLLFTELPFLDRFEAAAKTGFRGVEFLFPYDWAAADIAARLKAQGLELVLHNLPPGNWDAGERGIACHPDRMAEFRAGVGRALAYAQALGVRQLHCMAGIAPAGFDAGEVRRTLVENLRFAACELRREGLRLLVEPINTFDFPGYWLTRTAQALDLMDEVAEDNVLLQYDIYHAQRMEGELANTLAAQLPRIGHIQIADNPGRHEPGSGEINYPFLFDLLDQLGYAGWVGCEYRPLHGTVEGLGWRGTLSSFETAQS